MERMARCRLLLVTIGLCLALASCRPYEFKGTEYPDPQPAPDFELSDVQDGTYRLGDHKGQILLLYFGYTSCPDICPGTLAVARRVLDDLGPLAGRVRLLFVTVDPERDTPEVMTRYVSVFHPNIIGLTGAPEQLEAVFADYGIVAEKETLPDSAIGYVMNHTTRLFLVDPDGRLRLSYSYGTLPEDILSDIRHLLE